MKPVFFLSLLMLLSLACSGSRQALDVAQAEPSPPPTVSPSLTPTPSPTPETPTRLVCADLLNLRQTPGAQAAVLTVLTHGQVVTLTHQRETTPDGGTWVRVERDPLSGWVNLKYLCER
jgi:hypothetical protein